MTCPNCGSKHQGTNVIDSRFVRAGGYVRRRRACPDCGLRFSTRETIERGDGFDEPALSREAVRLINALAKTVREALVIEEKQAPPDTAA